MHKLAVIDDDNIDSFILSKHMVIGCNVRVDCYRDPVDALATIVENSGRIAYDLIAVDLDMPAMTGIEFALRMKEALADRCPLLVAYSDGSFCQERDLLDAVFDGYIQKPVKIGDMDDVVESIRVLLDGPAAGSVSNTG